MGQVASPAAAFGIGRRGRIRRRERPHQHHGTRADSVQRNLPEHSSALLGWQDKQLIDNVTMIKGNHLLQFGGSYERHYDYHMRTDNGVGVNNQIVYWLSNSGILNWTNSPYIPSTVPSSQFSSFETLYTEALGIVSNTQVAYARSGQQLNLQPLGSPAFNQSVIPYYNFYFSDTWH